jgi:indole-3-glycerol phosphate synthase
MTRLNDFVAAARRRVADGAYALDGPRLRPHGSLAAAIARDQHTIIAELKPASPSGRLLHRPASEIISAYNAGGATALSVLAASDDFDGSPALVRDAHTAGLPLLWKDFILDEAQLDCAAHCGASAVLLIERCFADATAREGLVAAAHERGLEVLLEVFGEADAKRAAGVAGAAGGSATGARTAGGSAADLIGVNARDLETLRVDLLAANALVARLAGRGRPVLALSGIRDRVDRRAAARLGAAGVLVGSGLVTQPDPALALIALRRPLAKVCGITDADTVATAAEAGADLVGFVVGSPDSPRDLAVADAADLAVRARAAGTRTVLVTRARDASEVAGWSAAVQPDFVQVHHGPAAARLDAQRVLHAIAPDATLPTRGGLVLDTPRPDGTTGGAGRPHDWSRSAALVARSRGRISLIAGGLAAENAAAAIAATGAWGADASSRLELTRGKKDANAVAAFVAAVHEANA